MEKSESIKNIAQALITFHIKVEKIPKDASNPFFKSKYASLSNILDAINDPLNESGLTFCQFPCGEHGLNTILMHAESGEFISEYYTMRPTKDDPQGIGSAITYQRRYALASVLGLNIDDDDDGNEASKPAARKDAASETKKETPKTNGEDRPWLNKNTLQYKAVIKRLREGSATIAQIIAHYKLSKEMKTELENIKPEMETAPF